MPAQASAYGYQTLRPVDCWGWHARGKADQQAANQSFHPYAMPMLF